MKPYHYLAAVGLLLFSGAAFAADPSPWPKGAKVFFVEPKDGTEVSSPVKVIMGAEGIAVAPAGEPKPGVGHHHIFIDADPAKGEAASFAIPADETHVHFGKAQTQTELKLAPGKHTLQLVFGDGGHVQYDPPLASDKITVTVK